MSKKALGRGIGALLGDDGEQSRAAAVEVSLAALAPNPHQPRQEFDDAPLRELADSIREKGVLQPVLVEQAGDGRYVIVAGERRVRAARIAGLATVPVIVRSFTDQEKLEIALIENVQRTDLSPLEEARAYRRLMEMGGLGQEQLARRVGKDRSTVANTLRLLKLPDGAQAALSRGDITAGHARALLSLVNPSDVDVLLQRVVERGLSVRAAEDEAAQLNGGRRGAGVSPSRGGRPGKGSPARPDAHLRELEQALIEKLGTKVEVRGSTKKGTIAISWFTADDLERLMEELT